MVREGRSGREREEVVGEREEVVGERVEVVREGGNGEGEGRLQDDPILDHSIGDVCVDRGHLPKLVHPHVRALTVPLVFHPQPILCGAGSAALHTHTPRTHTRS